MPVVQRPDKTVAPTTGQAKPVEMKTAVVESRSTPFQHLLVHIAGARVVSPWYFQLLGSNDAPKALDLGLEPAQQQYMKINQMEWRQQGDLSHTPDDQDKEWTITGSGITLPGVAPQTGDMFVIDLGQGTWGIASVTESTPLSIQKQTCYRFMFRVLYRNDNRRLENLERKTVDRRHYVLDFLRSGKNPLIVDESYSEYRRLDQLYLTMVADYFRTFFSDTVQSLILPGVARGAYDPFLVKAIQSLLATTDHPMLTQLTRHAVDIQYAYKTTTIWDALLNVEPSYLYLASQQIGLVSKNVLRDRGVFGGLYWTSVQQVMFPKDDRTDVNVPFSRVIIDPSVVEPPLGGAPVTDLERLILNTPDTVNLPLVDDEDSSIPVVPMLPVWSQVCDENYYVFPKSFYERDELKMSQLEKLVWSVLNQNEVDIKLLRELVDMSRRWDRIQRFYYVPVLIWLCVIAFRGPTYN